MKTVTFFETREELRALTGLPGDNLDDWDFGFVCDVEWVDNWWDNSDGRGYYEHWLLDRMDSHCVGYKHTEYNGRHYYLLYHS